MDRIAANAVEELLKSCTGPLTLERLVDEIHDKGNRGVTKAQVSEYLAYASCNGLVKRVRIPGRSADGWILTDGRKRTLGLLPPSSATAPSERHRSSVMDRLYPWQRRALAKWEADGYCGIIEAVTGSGKTMVALAA